MSNIPQPRDNDPDVILPQPSRWNYGQTSTQYPQQMTSHYPQSTDRFGYPPRPSAALGNYERATTPPLPIYGQARSPGPNSFGQSPSPTREKYDRAAYAARNDHVPSAPAAVRNSYGQSASPTHYTHGQASFPTRQDRRQSGNSARQPIYYSRQDQGRSSAAIREDEVARPLQVNEEYWHAGSPVRQEPRSSMQREYAQPTAQTRSSIMAQATSPTMYQESSSPEPGPIRSTPRNTSRVQTHRDSIDTRPPMRRLATHDIELGVSEVLQRHVSRHVADAKPVSQLRLRLEHKRPRFFREMCGEAIGVFIYVYAGIASTASLTFRGYDAAWGSVFQVGWAYAIGLAFAIILCATTSGGHFSPAITLNLAVWQGFPWWKVPYYIFAQILGAFVAGLILVCQYDQQFSATQAVFENAGLSLTGPNTPASILCPFPQPLQNNEGWLFAIEFFASAFLYLMIWTVLDPANPFISPASAPFAVGIAYAVTIWGFAEITVSLNTARDLGTRLVALIFFGSGAFPTYSWIPIVANIPASFLSTLIYECLLRDSLDRIALGHADHVSGEKGLREHFLEAGLNQPAPAHRMSTKSRRNYE